MPRKYLIALFFMAFAPPLAGQGLAQQPQTECPPECVTDSLEIVTWYPSPYNEYEELRLYPKFSADESDCNSGDKLGLMYYNKDEQALKICWQDPSDLSYSWEKIGSEQSGLSRLGNYATGNIPSCSSAILGSLVYDTTEKRPYVCAQNTSNNPVWKPLDSDYDSDGVTDAVDYNDNDANDAIAIEADVLAGKTFYSGGRLPKARKTGTLVESVIGGLCTVTHIGFTSGWHYHSEGTFPIYIVKELLGSASSNQDTKCRIGAVSYDNWHDLNTVCSCPSGYTLTRWREYKLLGMDDYITTDFYCRKN